MFFQVRNLNKKYNDFYAIKNINFSLNEGELLCILGPSGCGKSTILNSIGGFIDCHGDIILDNKNITNLPPEEREVSTVFQSLGLFPHMNVIENISYGLKFRGFSKSERYEKSLEMLKTLDLENYENRKITELSGGERQRIALGRSLIVNPKLLLLDEPLSSLDAKLQKSMRLEIKKFQKEFNITTIFVTHNQDDAFEISDKILVLNKGEIMQSGSATEIYENPKNEFVLNFIGNSNIKNDYFTRLEDVKIVENGIKAKILNVIFKGSIIELSLQTDFGIFNSITINNGKKYNVGDVINIEINRRSL